MGWWKQNPQASWIAVDREDGPELLWGDGPADELDHAIDNIVKHFQEKWGRRPTKDEMRAGLEFSLGGNDEVGRP